MGTTRSKGKQHTHHRVPRTSVWDVAPWLLMAGPAAANVLRAETVDLEQLFVVSALWLLAVPVAVGMTRALGQGVRVRWARQQRRYRPAAA